MFLSFQGNNQKFMFDTRMYKFLIDESIVTWEHFDATMGNDFNVDVDFKRPKYPNDRWQWRGKNDNITV